MATQSNNHTLIELLNITSAEGMGLTYAVGARTLKLLGQCLHSHTIPSEEDTSISQKTILSKQLQLFSAALDKVATRHHPLNQKVRESYRIARAAGTSVLSKRGVMTESERGGESFWVLTGSGDTEEQTVGSASSVQPTKIVQFQD